MAIRHAKPGEVVDLQQFGGELKHARTTAIVKSSSFEAVHLVVHAGDSIPPHKVEGAITLHCLEGRIELGFSDTTLELRANQWIYLNGGVTHSVRGVVDSAILLTILFRH